MTSIKRKHIIFNDLSTEPVGETLEENANPAKQDSQPTTDGPTGLTDQRGKKFKPSFKRIAVDPKRQYHTPESRESWGPNVKGKKFRKEKGKKKRCPNAGVRIDGAVNSVRLDA